MRSRRARLSLFAIGCGLAAFAAAHVVMEAASRYAEVQLGAALWDGEDHLQLFTPTHWVDRGENRVLLCGPSEAREAFRLDVFDRELPGLESFTAAQSWGTLEDFVLMLEYLELVYGPAAMPAHIVLGVTPRFASGGGLHLSPVVRHIDKYSPHLSTTRTESGLELVPKSAGASLEARWRWRGRQGKRYEGAAIAFGRELARLLELDVADGTYLTERLDPYRFAHRPPRGPRFVASFVDDPQLLWQEVQRWDAREDVERLEREIARLRHLCDTHDISLTVVNLPVRPSVRSFYDAELYAAYVSMLRQAFSNAPFLDLHDLLGDDEFFDSVHTTRRGAGRVSHAAAALVARKLDTRIRDVGS